MLKDIAVEPEKHATSASTTLPALVSMPKPASMVDYETLTTFQPQAIRKSAGCQSIRQHDRFSERV